MHKFLIHKKGDHVGIATSDIEAGVEVIGVFMDDDSTIEIVSNGAVPLGHKIAVVTVEAKGAIIEYGLPVGYTPEGIKVGDYVHTHNMKTLRW